MIPTPPRHGRQEGPTLVVGQPQRVRERTHGVRVGAFSRTALQSADGVGGEACPLGQLLLSQPGGLAKSSQVGSEGSTPLWGRVTRSSPFHNPKDIPTQQYTVRAAYGLLMTSCDPHTTRTLRP